MSVVVEVIAVAPAKKPNCATCEHSQRDPVLSLLLCLHEMSRYLEIRGDAEPSESYHSCTHMRSHECGEPGAYYQKVSP